jgi:hypothetical protein
MTPDDIIEMARQAAAVNGTIVSVGFDGEFLEAFAKLVDDKATAREREAFAAHAVDIARRAVAQEREACAQVLDEMADQMVADMEPSALIAWVRNRATAIRARGES